MSDATDLGGPLEIRTQIVNDYLYSYGGISPFFRALRDRQQLMGTRCRECAKVYCPPRTRCGECYVGADWIDLPPTGTVVSAIDCYYVPANYDIHRYLDLPYTLVLVRVDGADTGLYSTVFVPPPHRRGQVGPGARVRARFRQHREGRLTDVYFVLDKEGQE